MQSPLAADIRVLIVDDEPDIRMIERLNLDLAGLGCAEAGTGSEALDLLASERFDLVLLDVTLPDVDGLSVLRAIRSRDDLPVILVTGYLDTAHVQLGFELGADDYVTKPFEPGELLARIRAVLRRSHRSADPALPPATAAVPPDPIPSPHPDAVVVDRATRTVLVDGAELDMTRREFDVLAVLTGEPGRVFSRDELLEAAWGSRPEWQDPATVTEHVHRLRVKLEGLGRAGCIETVRGVGYRFVRAVTTPAR